MGKQRRNKAGEKAPTEGVRGSLMGFADIAREAKLGVYASSGAFYIFLSIFPTAALLCSLLPLLPRRLARLRPLHLLVLRLPSPLSEPPLQILPLAPAR